MPTAYIYSDQPIKKKSKWTISSTLKGGISANLVREFTVQEINDVQITVNGVSKITTDPNNKEFATINGMPTRFEGSGDMTSTLVLDAKTGWIISANVNQQIDGKNIIKAQGQEMTIPIKMSSHTSLNNSSTVK
ncbi:DUF6263 family protein [Flammeovirga pacifica]|uniref:Uncharacterized protein n=1 Tax=Flammeovirga pacifica TaxID=915059 RepID=A0A1S1Z1H7_FLAPC|nr:DUF6263 family protein [Flammeovirga pacifica]OHX67120.1 hypothetical protein NH26_12590 [Flammeovirga pacifica]